MRTRLLLCVSYVTLLTVISLTNGAVYAQDADIQQRESALATSAGIAVGDLSQGTVDQIKSAVAAESALKSAVTDQTAAQQKLTQTSSDLASAQNAETAARQKLNALNIDPVAAANGLVTTASQAKLEAAMNVAKNAYYSAEDAYDQALKDANIARQNPKAYTKAELDAIEPRVRNAQEHRDEAQRNYENVSALTKTDVLSAVQEYNAVKIKLNTATAEQTAAQTNFNNATATVNRATAASTSTQAALTSAVGSDATAAVARASVLANPDGAKLLNIVNAQQLVSTGGINLSWLDPKQRAAMDASGASAVAKNGIVSVSDLTPAMMAKIVASGAGNITVQGGGIVSTSGSGIVASGAGNIAQLAAVANIVASGAGNIISTNGGGIVASGAGNIVASGAGNIISTNGGGIVASGAGNLGALMNSALANAQVAETALLTAGVKASIIDNDGASIIAKNVAQGLITNDGGSLITNDGGSLITNDGGSLAKFGAKGIISNDGASAIAKNAAAVIGTNVADLVAKNVAAGIVASGAGNMISTNGGGIISTNGGGIVATGAGNVGVSNASNAVASANLANLASNLAVRGPVNYKAASDSNPAAPAASAAAAAARTAAAATAQPASQTSTAPKGVPGGGFRQETQITISGNYGPDSAAGQTTTKPATTVVAAAPATPTSTAAPTSTIPKNYDPNDWTTWPKADVASFLPPGKSVQQFKSGAEQDLETYKKNLAALPTSGLTKSQQDQKAGMEAQIRSLEFQVDTANRALGLPNSTTTVISTAPAAPQPVMSASAIAATVTLPADLAAAQQRVNDRAQQMASANQQLQQWQAQRATTTDAEKLKGLDAAISSAKFQLDVMQQALDRENKNVADLQASAAKTAALTSAPAVTPSAVPAPAVPLKITSTEQKGLEDALRTIPGKLSVSDKKTFNSLSVLAQKAVSKGLTPAEGAQLMQGIKALAQRHPKGVERYKLTSLVNSGGDAGGRPGALNRPAKTHAVVPAEHPGANGSPPAAIAKQVPEPASVKPGALQPHAVHQPAAVEHGPIHGAAAPAQANRSEPAKPVVAHQHPAAMHPVAPPKPEHHHPPVAHVAAPIKPAAAAPKPHIANVPKPVAVAKPVAAPKPVAPPKPVAAPAPVHR
jgi:hypothetical protein